MGWKPAAHVFWVELVRTAGWCTQGPLCSQLVPLRPGYLGGRTHTALPHWRISYALHLCLFVYPLPSSFYLIEFKSLMNWRFNCKSIQKRGNAACGALQVGEQCGVERFRRWHAPAPSKSNLLVVQWLALCAFTAEGAGSIPGWGSKILQAAVQEKKKKDDMLRGTNVVLNSWTSFDFVQIYSENHCCFSIF